ncbi:hypothetical protein KSF_086760 [Reticulibacter mediterranei]|uniref:Methyltransferase domain-containing protein n=1 Tax=Reticulibacter mediterranei TaxID=2778369 RepID=A0A8J3IQY0_9CHLR|nr:class I SAM-dependent methyltransferase [Reticulibacter mediterranei]GHO98628.1 hypothetical protein KSF_086760 [Reticulibacter mediterranei]
MQPPLNPSENKTTYFINPNDSGETQRLLDYDLLMTRAMGERLFPDSYTPSTGSLVIDFACGPGRWVNQAAFEYPESEFYGVDISSTMIRYARAQAQAQRLPNLTFQEGSVLDPQPFPGAAFDFVNARCISSFMPVSAWKPFLEEGKRITRPGGIIRLTEAEWLYTNSEAGEKIADLATRAQWLTGKSFSPDGKRFGSTLALPKLFREARLEDIQKQAYHLDVSFGTQSHALNYQMILAGLEMMRAFLVKTGVTTKDAFDALCQQFDYEMQDPNFLGCYYLLSVWGKRP